MKKIPFKKFIGDNFNISYRKLYDQKSILFFYKKAFENYLKDKIFKSDENKLFKILAGKIYDIEDIEKLCTFISDEDLKELQGLNVNIEKENIIKEINKMSKLIRIKKLEFIYFIFNFIQINKDRLNKVLSDNELTIEKIKLIGNEQDIKYIAKKPFLLGLLKLIPFKVLKKIKENIDNKNK